MIEFQIQKVLVYVFGYQLFVGKLVLIMVVVGVGIGFVVVCCCVEEGCCVLFILDIYDKCFVQVVEMLCVEIGLQQVYGCLCNVVVEVDVQVLVVEVQDRFDGVDVLINNVGFGGLICIVDMDDVEWLCVIDISFIGMFWMMCVMLLYMQVCGCGVIVNNVLVFGWCVQVEQVYYVVVKVGVMVFMCCVVFEVLLYGVCINVVVLSIVMYDFLKKLVLVDLLN